MKKLIASMRLFSLAFSCFFTFLWFVKTWNAKVALFLFPMLKYAKLSSLINLNNSHLTGTLLGFSHFLTPRWIILENIWSRYCCAKAVLREALEFFWLCCYVSVSCVLTRNLCFGDRNHILPEFHLILAGCSWKLHEWSSYMNDLLKCSRKTSWTVTVSSLGCSWNTCKIT